LAFWIRNGASAFERIAGSATRSLRRDSLRTLHLNHRDLKSTCLFQMGLAAVNQFNEA
jgi:hypothetical protein